MNLKPGIQYKVEVTFKVNEIVSLARVKGFIIDALEDWGGQLHPDDELFGSLEGVKVVRTLSKSIVKA